MPPQCLWETVTKAVRTLHDRLSSNPHSGPSSSWREVTLWATAMWWWSSSFSSPTWAWAVCVFCSDMWTVLIIFIKAVLQDDKDILYRAWFLHHSDLYSVGQLGCRQGTSLLCLQNHLCVSLKELSALRACTLHAEQMVTSLWTQLLHCSISDL